MQSFAPADGPSQLDVAELKASVQNIERLLAQYQGEDEDDIDKEIERQRRSLAVERVEPPSPTSDAASDPLLTPRQRRPSVVRTSINIVSKQSIKRSARYVEEDSSVSDSSEDGFLEFLESDLHGEFDFELTSARENVNDLIERLKAAERVEVTEGMEQWFKEATEKLKKVEEELNEKEERGLEEEYDVEVSHAALRKRCDSRFGDVVQHMMAFHQRMQEVASSLALKPAAAEKRRLTALAAVAGQTSPSAATEKPGEDSPINDAKHRLSLALSAVERLENEKEPSSQNSKRKGSVGKGSAKAKANSEVSSIASELLDVISKQQHEIAHLHTKVDLNRRKDELIRSILDYTVAEREAQTAAEAQRSFRFFRPPVQGPTLSAAADELMQHMQNDMRIKATDDMMASEEGREYLRQALGDQAKSEFEDALEQAAVKEDRGKLENQKQELLDRLQSVGNPKEREDNLKRQIKEQREALKTIAELKARRAEELAAVAAAEQTKSRNRGSTRSQKSPRRSSVTKKRATKTSGKDRPISQGAGKPSTAGHESAGGLSASAAEEAVASTSVAALAQAAGTAPATPGTVTGAVAPSTPVGGAVAPSTPASGTGAPATPGSAAAAPGATASASAQQEEGAPSAEPAQAAEQAEVSPAAQSGLQELLNALGEKVEQSKNFEAASEPTKPRSNKGSPKSQKSRRASAGKKGGTKTRTADDPASQDSTLQSTAELGSTAGSATEEAGASASSSFAGVARASGAAAAGVEGGGAESELPGDEVAIPNGIHELLASLGDKVEEQGKKLEAKKSAFFSAMLEAADNDGDAGIKDDPRSQLRALVKEKKEVMERSLQDKADILEQLAKIQDELARVQTARKEAAEALAAQEREEARRQAAIEAGENPDEESEDGLSISDVSDHEGEAFVASEPHTLDEAKTYLKRVSQDIRKLEDKRSSLQQKLSDESLRQGIEAMNRDDSPPRQSVASHPSLGNEEEEEEEGSQRPSTISSSPMPGPSRRRSSMGFSRSSTTPHLGVGSGSETDSPQARRESRLSRAATGPMPSQGSGQEADSSRSGGEVEDRPEGEQPGDQSPFSKSSSAVASGAATSAKGSPRRGPGEEPPRTGSALTEGGHDDEANPEMEDAPEVPEADEEEMVGKGSKDAQGRRKAVTLAVALAAKLDKITLQKREDKVGQLLRLHQEHQHIRFKIRDIERRIREAKAVDLASIAASKSHQLMKPMQDVPEANLQKRKQVAQMQKQVTKLREEWLATKGRDGRDGREGRGAALDDAWVLAWEEQQRQQELLQQDQDGQQQQGQKPDQQQAAPKRRTSRQVEAAAWKLLQELASNRLAVGSVQVPTVPSKETSLEESGLKVVRLTEPRVPPEPPGSDDAAAGSGAQPPSSRWQGFAPRLPLARARWLSAVRSLQSNKAPEGNIASGWDTARPERRFIMVTQALMQQRKADQNPSSPQGGIAAPQAGHERGVISLR